MGEMAASWSHQESINELKLKIHFTEVELEAVKAKANEEMNKNTESVKQLLQLLKLVCYERDEARDQMHKILNKIMPSINDHMFSDCLMIDHQVHQNYYSMKPAKANSSIAESNSLSDAYNHSSSHVDSLFDTVTSPEFNVNKNTLFVQDCQNEMMLFNGFHILESVTKIDPDTLTMESMIKGKNLPQKGKLLQSVKKAGPLLQTLLATSPLPGWQNLSPPLQSFCNIGGQNHVTMMTKESQPFFEISSHEGCNGGSILSFNDVNFSNCQGRMVAGCPMASNFGLLEKRQRLQ